MNGIKKLELFHKLSKNIYLGEIVKAISFFVFVDGSCIIKKRPSINDGLFKQTTKYLNYWLKIVTVRNNTCFQNSIFLLFYFSRIPHLDNWYT